LSSHDSIGVEVELQCRADNHATVGDKINGPRGLDLFPDPVPDADVALSQHVFRHLDGVGMGTAADIHQDVIAQVTIAQALGMLALGARGHGDHLLVKSQKDYLRKDVVIGDRPLFAAIDAGPLSLLTLLAL
jgi:hypothetical protein